MTEQSKAEQELIEKIITTLKQFENTAFYPFSSSVLEAQADRIHTLYKGAGYVQLADQVAGEEVVLNGCIR